MIGAIAAAARLKQMDDAGSAGGSTATASARAEPVFACAGQNQLQALDAARYRLLRDWWFGLSIALGPDDLRGALTPEELDAKLDEGLRRRAGP